MMNLRESNIRVANLSEEALDQPKQQTTLWTLCSAIETAKDVSDEALDQPRQQTALWTLCSAIETAKDVSDEALDQPRQDAGKADFWLCFISEELGDEALDRREQGALQDFATPGFRRGADDAGVGIGG